jgi:enterochelin esterase-like enzyme
MSRYFALILCCGLLTCAQAGESPGQASVGPQSPRLAGLLAALEQNDGSALDAFWKEVEKEHTPLVEDLPNQPHAALYTFLFRADPADDVVNVRLGADFPMHTQNYTDIFQRLGKSDVWYTSYVLPKASRITYRIRVPQGLNRSPASPARFTINGVLYEHFLDPLNPRVFPEGPQYEDAQSSYYIGSEAPSNPYLRRVADVPRGSLQTFEIDSQVLRSKRTVTIYTPASYASSVGHLPLVLLFDAESYVNDEAVPTMLDNLIFQSVTPPVVVAFVHTNKTREQDLQPNAAYQEFMVSELVPWLRKHYRVSTDPKQNVVGGFSLGGLAAAYTAFMHPDVFGNVLSQSGSYWWSPNYEQEILPSPNAGWMVKQFAESARKPLRFYMSVGSWESAGMLSSNRILFSVLKGKGNEVRYREDAMGHNQANFQQTFPDGVIMLLGGKTSRQ